MTRSYICDIFFLGDKNMFKKICSSILCFILFWAIFASTFFVSVQQEFSLMNRAKALELENIDITNLDMNDINKLLKDELKANGYPVGLAEYVMKDDNALDMINDYKNQYIEYLKGNTDAVPVVDTNKVKNIVDSNVKAYNVDHKNSQISIDSSKIASEVSSSVNTSTKKLSENKSVDKPLKFIFNLNNQIVSNYVVIVTLILLIVINKKYVFKYLVSPFLLNGIFNFLIFIILKFAKIKIIELFLGDTYTNMVNIIKWAAIIYIVISGICKVISIMINKSDKKEAKVEHKYSLDDSQLISIDSFVDKPKKTKKTVKDSHKEVVKDDVFEDNTLKEIPTETNLTDEV